MKADKLLKLVGCAMIAMQLIGCASTSTLIQNSVKNGSKMAEGGVTVGHAWAPLNNIIDIKLTCEAIQNADPACQKPNDYKIVFAVSWVGWNAGAQGQFAVVPKSIDIKDSTFTGCSDCTYIKVQAQPGQLAKLIDVLDRGGEGKCTWAGLKGAGGAVCDGVWDYRKDFVKENWLGNL